MKLKINWKKIKNKYRETSNYKMARSSLGIVIPALNEEKTIGRIIIKLKNSGMYS